MKMTRPSTLSRAISRRAEAVALKFDPIRPRVHPSSYVCRTALQISHNYANGIHSRMHAFCGVIAVPGFFISGISIYLMWLPHIVRVRYESGTQAFADRIDTVNYNSGKAGPLI